MKLNFMHILANLGFGGVYPIYWIKESKHAITQRLVNMHAKTFKNQTRYKLDKTPRKTRRHTKARHDIRLSNLYQRSKPTHDLKDTNGKIHQRKMSNTQKIKVPKTKPNPLHFSLWHKVPRRKGLSSTKTCHRDKIPIEKDQKIIEENQCSK